jgi:phosphomannomutase
MIYLFDVDGVLTDTGYNIDPAFKDWFIKWSKGKRYALVTGSALERTIEQVGEDIVENAILVANCMGNSVYQEGRKVNLNEFTFSDEEQQFLLNFVKNTKFDIKAGNHLVSRPGSYNFSVVGRDATNPQREKYKQFDERNKERLMIAEQFKERFPHYDVYIGGDISIDICMKGANKGQVIDYISNMKGDSRLAFFGDKMDEWGIDTPLKHAVRKDRGRSFAITGGYTQTKQILLHTSEAEIITSIREEEDKGLFDDPTERTANCA